MMGWNVNTFNSTTNVRVSYGTTFTSGPATESFIYRIEAGKALLVGYNINSLALITK